MNLFAGGQEGQIYLPFKVTDLQGALRTNRTRERVQELSSGRNNGNIQQFISFDVLENGDDDKFMGRYRRFSWVFYTGERVDCSGFWGFHTWGHIGVSACVRHLQAN